MEQKKCDGCGREISDDTCWCGDLLDSHHAYSGHSAVPMGCECHQKHAYSEKQWHMTHSGGKAHAVGDLGQRFEVTVFDEPSNKRVLVGWTDDAETARKMADGADLRPSWKWPQVWDRTVCPGCGKPYPSECDWCAEDRPKPPSRRDRGLDR